MRILVTGAGGLIGGYLASSFAENGCQVVATYRNAPPNLAGTVISKIECVQLDIAEGMNSLGPLDVIIHAAAHTHSIPNSTASDYVRSNIIGTTKLAEFAKASGAALVVYLSTLSIYGRITVPELDEETPPNGPEMYGMTKLMGEFILRDYTRDFPSVCIRLPGVVGPGYFKPWIGGVVERASRDEPIGIYNPDSLFNNIVDLHELSRFISRIIEIENHGHQPVNLAAADPISIREVVERIIKLTGSNSHISQDQTDDQSFLINCDKLRDFFGFEPAPTKSIVDRYVAKNLPYLMQGQQSEDSSV